MKIKFVLPCYGIVPIGGLKVVYEYCNWLSENNYDVEIIYPASVDKSETGKSFLLNYLRYLKSRVLKNYTPESWFKLNKNISSSLVPYLDDKYIKDGDAVFATSWETAGPVYRLSPEKGKKFYLIQSYEIWSGDKSEVDKTWRYPFERIVISKWLVKTASDLKVNVNYIPNGIDQDVFYLEKKIEERVPDSILMLFSEAEVKGSYYALNSIKELKKKNKSIKLTLFSTYDRPVQIEDWINYVKLPSPELLRELYNTHAIFVSPSFVEGFPLPPAEAMCCGCAVIASDIGGHREYCEDGQTALLFEPGNQKELEDKINILISENSFRLKLANSGYENILKYKWETSFNEFGDLLKKNLINKNEKPGNSPEIE